MAAPVLLHSMAKFSKAFTLLASNTLSQWYLQLTVKPGHVSRRQSCVDPMKQGKWLDRASAVVSFLQRRHVVFACAGGRMPLTSVLCWTYVHFGRETGARAHDARADLVLMNKKRVCVRVGLLWAALAWRPGRQRRPCLICRWGFTQERSASTESYSISSELLPKTK